MEKIKVLVLDDDLTLLAGLKASLLKSGYEVYVASSTSEALESIQSNEISNLIVDCLLPGESGIDFVKKLKQSATPVENLILISGFFTDAGFIREAIAETGAKDFLAKPFDHDKLVRLLPKSQGAEPEHADASEARKILYHLFSKTERDQRQMRKLFEQIEVVHGFDLPLIYNLLMESKVSGFLNLSSEDGKIFGVNFCSGEIVGVDLEDKDTFLGKLLIEHGFLTSGDLDAALSKKKGRRLGEALIQDHLISPHAMEIAMSEQMGIRLSRTIIDQEVRFNFAMSDVELSRPSISLDLFNAYLHDWINSKLNLYWLRAQLTEWRFSGVKRTPNSDLRLGEIVGYPIFQSYNKMKDHILNEPVLERLFEEFKDSEEELLKMTYLLLTKGVIYFEERDISEFTQKTENLKVLFEQLNKSNQTQAINLIAKYVNVDPKVPDILKITFFNYLTPFEKSKDENIIRLVSQIKQKAQEVFKLQVSQSNEAQKERANLSLEAMKLLDEGKSLIQKGQSAEAVSKLAQSLKIYPKLPGQRLYHLWAKLQARSAAINEEFLREIEVDLLKIEPEDKHDAVCHFVVGLFQKYRSNKEVAIRSFEKALALDSQFIQARRELVMLRASQDQIKTGVLDADLKSLVGQLFSKNRSK